MGSNSSDGTTVVDIQVQNIKGKKIHLETLDETTSSTPFSAIEISYQAIKNVSIDLYQNHYPLKEYDSYK